MWIGFLPRWFDYLMRKPPGKWGNMPVIGNTYKQTEGNDWIYRRLSKGWTPCQNHRMLDYRKKPMRSLHIEHLHGFITEVVDDEVFFQAAADIAEIIVEGRGRAVLHAFS